MQIELVPTQSLIEELMNRFDHVVISGIIDGGDQYKEIWRHKGNSRTCQGLATGLTFQIQKYRDDRIDIEQLGEGEM